MIPIKLKIQGFLSYQEAVTLDFSGISLACISGQNGAGKSALLDAITWALFGQARKRDESLINNNPNIDAAEVTLDFDYEGDRYRVQRTNPRGKTSAVEFFILQSIPGETERWKPLTERTLRETDKKIEQTLRMDYDTFTNAAFFLQGKADQFATARPGERKRILSNILGLEVWESYREEAASRRRQKEREVRELDGRLSEIQNELDEGPERKRQLGELHERLDAVSAQRKALAENFENIQRLHASVQEQRKVLVAYGAQLEGAQRDYQRILATLSERQTEKTKFEATLQDADAIEMAYANWQRARTDLGAMEEVAEAYRRYEALRQEPLRLIDTEEARLTQEKRGLEAKAKELENALTQAALLEAQLEDARQEVQTAREKITRREGLEEEIRQLQATQAEAKAENPRLKQEMDDLRARLDQLEAADKPECPVCGKPLSTGDRDALIRDYYQEGEARRDRYLENKKLLDNFDAALRKLGADFADLNGADAELRQATRKVDQIENQIQSIRTQHTSWEAKDGPRLHEIEVILSEGTFALDARQRLDEIRAETEALGYDVVAHEKLRKAEQAGREAEGAMLALKEARAALAPIKQQITELEVQKVEKSQALEAITQTHDAVAATLAAAEVDLPDLTQAENDLLDIQEAVNILTKQVGGAEQKVNVLTTLQKRKEELLEEREGLTQHIANLQQLERAFGKDGVPALLIEQALPEIEETTNDLLSRLTNDRMSFTFMTQRDYKDASREDKKETLDMVISDSVGVRDYEMFSGGEAFRINFSIRLALSQVLARRAGARLQTLVIDEGFGSQDAQGRQRLVEAINLVKDDFAKILVITHLDELKDAFPTRIEVEKTPQGSQIQVI